MLRERLKPILADLLHIDSPRVPLFQIHSRWPEVIAEDRAKNRVRVIAEIGIKSTNKGVSEVFLLVRCPKILFEIRIEPPSEWPQN